MTADTDQTYRAVAIEGTLFAHAHVVDLFVEHNSDYALLPDAVRGLDRVRSSEEFDDLVDRGYATRLSDSLEVRGDDAGLLLDEAIPRVLQAAGSETLAACEKQVETTDGHVVIVSTVIDLADLRSTLADELTERVKAQIVDSVVAEAHGDEADFAAHTWQELDKWSECAIDCGAGDTEYQYKPLLTRAWLLQRKLASTQVNNLYEVFLSEALPRDQFDREIDEFERTIRAAVERKLWLRDLSFERVSDAETETGGEGRAADIIDIADHAQHPRTQID